VPPQITAIFSSSLTRSSATITWITSVPATSQVEYGTFAVDAFRSPIDPSLVTAHRVVLTGLLPGTQYRFHVRGTSASGGSSISVESSLVTAPAGSGPEIADIAVQQATGTTATVGWATSTGSVAQVEYGTTFNYGSFTLLRVFNSPSQSMTLTGLRPATTYHIRVKAWDATGALAASADASFSTAPAGLAMLVGDDTIQPERVTLVGGQASAFQYVASQSGQASNVRLYVDAGTTAPVIRVALYSDQDGAPSTILSQGSAPGLIAGWINVSIPPVAVLQSNRYWVAVLSPLGGGNVNLRQATTGGSSVSSAQLSLGAFPQAFAIGASGARSPLSAYLQQVPPAITLTGPSDDSVVTGQVSLSAVVDDDVPLARLQFYVDGLAVGAPVASAPYAVTWNSAGANSALVHTISARATDIFGRSSVSRLLNVQVDNGPTISNVVLSSGLTVSSARVTWNTDILADAQVEYGQTLAYGESTPLDARPDWRHDMQLTGLLPGAVYHFRVRSRDANGGVAVSADQTFFTPER
jgi:hypothetical protein